MENTESKEDKQDSLKVDLRDLEVLSLKGISKGENIQIYNQDFITKALAHQMNLDNNRLFYIESPFFNSRQLAELIIILNTKPTIPLIILKIILSLPMHPKNIMQDCIRNYWKIF